MHRYLPIAAALALSACASPQERCITDATKDLSGLDAQIAEAEINISRGYRVQDAAIDSIGVQACNQIGGVRICVGGEQEIQGRRIPIDVASERARLQALQTRRASEQATMERQIAACQTLG